MATSTANIIVGAATVSIGDYVTAGGAGSLTDVGHTKSPTTLASTYEDFEVISERVGGVLKKVPQMTRHKFKASLTEATIEHMRIAMRQPSANVSGTPPDLTLRVGASAEQYHQFTLVTVGVGTTAVRTLTIWRGIVESVSEIPYAKGAEQMFEIVIDALLDETVATADKFFKVVDA